MTATSGQRSTANGAIEKQHVLLNRKQQHLRRQRSGCLLLRSLRGRLRPHRAQPRPLHARATPTLTRSLQVLSPSPKTHIISLSRSEITCSRRWHKVPAPHLLQGRQLRHYQRHPRQALRPQRTSPRVLWEEIQDQFPPVLTILSATRAVWATAPAPLTSRHSCAQEHRQLRRRALMTPHFRSPLCPAARRMFLLPNGREETADQVTRMMSTPPSALRRCWWRRAKVPGPSC